MTRQYSTVVVHEEVSSTSATEDVLLPSKNSRYMVAEKEVETP